MTNQDKINHINNLIDAHYAAIGELMEEKKRLQVKEDKGKKKTGVGDYIVARRNVRLGRN